VYRETIPLRRKRESSEKYHFTSTVAPNDFSWSWKAGKPAMYQYMNFVPSKMNGIKAEVGAA
jgi:hypothetical protein